MTSPNGSSHGGKRKRAATAGSSTNPLDNPEMDQDQTIQTESRDASGEEGDTTAPESGRNASTHHRKADSSSSSHPPNKRQRASSGVTAASAATATGHAQAHAADPGEPSDTTEASVDIAQRVGGRKGNGGGARKASSSEDKETREKERKNVMPPPPIGKLTHPAGYRTNPPPAGRPIRVYADGVFDLFHLGHMRQLEQAKKAFPDVYLIVGVAGDEETHKRKGLTVLSGRERAETIRHCKWVDEVIEDCPWIVTTEFVEQHQIDYVAHDDLPYGAAEGDDIYAPIKAVGKFLVTQRTEGVSTTGIITKIVRDYEKYISRQLKRGTSRQELNVSWLKKNELDLKRHVQDLRDNIRSNWTTTGQELSRELRQFWPASRPQSPARPSSLFAAAASSQHTNGDHLPTSPLGPTHHHHHYHHHSASSSVARSPGPSSSPAPAGGERSGGQPNDFITGYTLGLIGGVRSWMTKSRRESRDSSRAPSDDDWESSDDRFSSDARRMAPAISGRS